MCFFISSISILYIILVIISVIFLGWNLYQIVHEYIDIIKFFYFKNDPLIEPMQ